MGRFREVLRKAVDRSVRTIRPWPMRLVKILGFVALTMVLLAFTRIPYDAHRWLGTVGGGCTNVPAYIVLLGGSGMPSGPQLMRLHYAASMAMAHPGAAVIVAHPLDSAVMQAMVDELLLRGVVNDRISRIMEGTNTREQVLRIGDAFPGAKPTNMAVITAPENMYRSLRAFRKIGFTQVCGVPAFDHAMFVDLRYAHRGIGGSRFVPDVSTSNDLRYNLWHHLHLQVTCMREYCAIAYYRLNGWI